MSVLNHVWNSTMDNKRQTSFDSTHSRWPRCRWISGKIRGKIWHDFCELDIKSRDFKINDIFCFQLTAGVAVDFTASPRRGSAILCRTAKPCLILAFLHFLYTAVSDWYRDINNLTVILSTLYMFWSRFQRTQHCHVALSDDIQSAIWIYGRAWEIRTINLRMRLCGERVTYAMLHGAMV